MSMRNPDAVLNRHATGVGSLISQEWLYRIRYQFHVRVRCVLSDRDRRW